MSGPAICGNCRFFLLGTTKGFPEAQGMCRRHAPRGPALGDGRWQVFPPSRVPEDSFSATELAQLLGVDGKAVTSWIEKGWLKATRASDAAGSPYRIKPAAIRTFIMDNVSLLKLGRVDPHWFVDLLGNKA